jgi:hypothetical protein
MRVSTFQPHIYVTALGVFCPLTISQTLFCSTSWHNVTKHLNTSETEQIMQFHIINCVIVYQI